jgi:hypothetical protein
MRLQAGGGGFYFKTSNYEEWPYEDNTYYTRFIFEGGHYTQYIIKAPCLDQHYQFEKTIFEAKTKALYLGFDHIEFKELQTNILNQWSTIYTKVINFFTGTNWGKVSHIKRG